MTKPFNTPFMVVTKNKRARIALLLSTLFATSVPAYAFNGYFASGQGVRAKAMGGASTAMIGDAFAAANNPAASLFSGNSFDIGIEHTVAKQTSERTGNGSGGYPETDTSVSGRRATSYPEFAYNKIVSADESRGFSFYRNGMIRIGYDNNNFYERLVDNRAGSGLTRHPDTLKVSMTQDVLAPVFAHRIGNESSIGISPLLVVQRLNINGLKSFIENRWSSYPENVTDRDTDESHGAGVRLGWMTRANDRLMLGATYSPKIRMTRFDRYKGLFTGDAHFDVPENYTAGLAFALNPATVLALDYQRIRYSGVQLLHSPGSIFLNPGINFGEANGPGFGWRDIGVWKLGYEWRYTSSITIRFGFSRSDSPIKQDDVALGVLLPGTTTSERSLGASYEFTRGNSLSFYFAQAQGPQLNGLSTLSVSGARELLSAKTHSFGFQYSHQF